MAQKFKLNRVNEESLRGMITAVLLLIFLILILMFIYFSISRTSQKRQNEDQFLELDKMEEQIKNNFAQIDEIFYLLEGLYFSLENEELPLQRTHQILESTLTSFMEYHTDIDQLRILSPQGMERIRINRTEYGVERVGPEDLQDKQERYYISDTLKLPKGSIYLSDLDLNMENGKLETPYKPMLRFGFLLRDFQGYIIDMVILNYLAQELFHDLDKLNTHDGDEIFLLNARGYLLHSPFPEKNFGFMFDQGDNLTIWNIYKDMPENLVDGRLMDLEGGLFYVKIINIESLGRKLSISDPKVYYLLMRVPRNIINRQNDLLLLGLLIGFLVFGPVLIILGFRLGKAQVQNRYYLSELEKNAFLDSMTGIANRRKLMDFLSYQMKVAKRNRSLLALVYIDLDNLKNTNDNISHLMGDEMIRTAALALKSSIRDTDMAARIGGDEFLLVIPDCSFEEIENVMLRAKDKYIYTGTEPNSIPWCFSWGVSYYHENDTLESFISRSDQKMYEMKQVHKHEKL